MKNRDHLSYLKVFKIINDEMIKSKLITSNWRLHVLHCDFEKAVIQAAKLFDKKVILKLCFFHYAKALPHNMRLLGLQSNLNTTDDCRITFIFCKILCICPPDLVKDGLYFF